MKIVIIGGVAAGMSGAARARRLDESAEIVVLERSQHVSFANCGLPYHIGGVIKDRDELLLQTPQSLRAALNLEVRVGHEVKAINRRAKTVKVVELKTGREYDEAYDKLLLSPGASPIIPNLSGVNHPRILALRNIDDMDRIKAALDAGISTAVVIGGGYVGVEMAENLVERGLNVELVEMTEQIMPPMDREMTRELEQHMQNHAVRLRLGVAAAAFSDAGGRVKIELTDGQTVTADVVILAVGVRPESGLAKQAGLETGARGGIKVNDHLQTSDPSIYAAGDAIEVVDHVTGQPAQIPLAGPANRQGRIAADNMCGRNSVYATTKGTAIVKLFDMTAAVTGATEKTLRKLGRPYGKLYIHPNGHAGYYPGTAPMHLKLLFTPDTGEILGAQITGFDGVDKRIDVLATAMQGNMMVRDLQNLELAYAPPYGAAKDPVNMAGFVASNMLNGDLDLWYAEDYPAKTKQGTILDVRTGEEFGTWHVPGAINVPISRLRKSLASLDKSKPVFVYCKVGFRSYLTHRILKQNGFDVSTLSGGTLTFRAWHGMEMSSIQEGRPVETYAEEKDKPVHPANSTGAAVELDVCGLQCPGPLGKLTERIKELTPGDDIVVTATDPGFAGDVPAWCKSNGHKLVDLKQSGAKTIARIRRGSADAMPTSASRSKKNKKTMVVFSGEMDKVLAAFVIANGAVSMGSEVTMFFTFWGLNALRKDGPQAQGKSLLDRMFGWMMPKGAARLKLSNMNMMGMGTAFMKHVMKSKRIDSLQDMIAQARTSGVKLVACSMSMGVMGLKREELMDGIEIGGVASFLGESSDADMTLFI
jgi:NADPH-dependent 2,4-dienoyl-CoA reductase/sulfur reductase-like enzyme/peroxiredoxin family protein/rhodanese-related sulfurtransferase/TusA-related sulfurtransferase